MELKSFGLCPVCRKGNIIKGSIGYSCNYFRAINDKCLFNIYSTYFKKEITEQIVKDLIEKGESEIFNDLEKSDGSSFSASLKIENGKVVPNFQNSKLNTPCPKCGDLVEELLTGYSCIKENCDFFIPKNLSNQEIAAVEAENLCKRKMSSVLCDFVNPAKEKFATRIVLDEEYKLKFLNYLCSCPKCGGDLYVGKKAYNCRNYMNESIKCKFVIWREIWGRNISPEEAILLCMDGETPVLSGFRQKGQELERKLIISDDYQIKIV